MGTTFIYALADPVTLEVRYIGKADDPYKRYCSHLLDKRPSHKFYWIQKLLGQGLLPIRQILEECDKSVWEQREKDWIAFYKKIGTNLTNKTEGGDGFKSKHSLLTKAKISKSLIGNTRCKGTHHTVSLVTKQKIQKALIGKNKGKTPSKEVRDKISKALRGRDFLWKHRPHTEEHKEHFREAMLGHVVTEETKKKIGLANKGKHPSKEAREKMSEAHRGKPRKKYVLNTVS